MCVCLCVFLISGQSFGFVRSCNVHVIMIFVCKYAFGWAAELWIYTMLSLYHDVVCVMYSPLLRVEPWVCALLCPCIDVLVSIVYSVYVFAGIYALVVTHTHTQSIYM